MSTKWNKLIIIYFPSSNFRWQFRFTSNKTKICFPIGGKITHSNKILLSRWSANCRKWALHFFCILKTNPMSSFYLRTIIKVFCIYTQDIKYSLFIIKHIWVFNLITFDMAFIPFLLWLFVRQNDYQCHICGKYFENKYVNEKHLQKKHLNLFCSYMQILILQATFVKCKHKTNWQCFQ